MPSKIAVAILNWNGKALLERFLGKVVEDSANLGQVYLIDNASSDDSLAYTKAQHPEVKIIALDNNYGYAGGYNRALAHLDEEIIVLLNSDIETSPNWLEPIAEAFAKHPKLGALQPKILDLKDRSKFEYAGASGGYIDKLGYPFCRGRLFDTLEEDQAQYNDFQNCFWATGACLVVRREAFKQVKGLYEVLFAHMEEIDLCWKMQISGWEIAVEPKSTVYHLGGATLDAASPQKTFLNFRNNLIILFLNLPHFEAMRIIFSRLILDGIAGLRFLSQGKLAFVWAIIRAHFAFYGLFQKLYAERMHRKQKAFIQMTGLYQSSILWAYFGQKKKSFKDLGA